MSKHDGCPRVQKLWGLEIWHHNETDYCVKTLILNHGFRCSLHYHKIKRETFVVVSGVVLLELGDRVLTLFPGMCQTIEPGTPHRFHTPTLPHATIIEASTFHDDSDVVRLEESTRI